MLLLASGAARAERPKILVLPVAGKAADAGLRERVAQALSEGLIASGGEVVAPPTGAAALPAEGCATPACLSGAARATGAAYLLRASFEEEGRSYTFKLEMLDGQSGAVLAQRENRCEICTDAEALEIANAAASALKAQALKKPGPPAAGPTVNPVAAPEHPTGPAARVTVLDRLDLPASLGEFHGKLRAALEGLVREQGLEVVAEPPVPANCGSTNCGEDLLRASGASHVLFVEGSRNDYGFSLDITLRSVSGDDSEKAQGWCNFCTGPQMVTAAENVARPLVVHLAARPERVPGIATGAAGTPGADLGSGAGGGKSTTRLALSWVAVGVGVAAIVAGSVLMHINDHGTCTLAPGVKECPELHDTMSTGVGFAGAGLVIGVTGVWGLAF
jgi:hypothetical protein